MKRLALAISTLVVLSAPAAAQSNCARNYSNFLTEFNTGPAKGITGDQLAIVNRQALRAFDACSAGDESGSKSIFDRLKEVAPAKGEDFWKALQQTAPAKK